MRYGGKGCHKVLEWDHIVLRSSTECCSTAKMNKQGGLFQGPMCKG